jgi:RNase H-fold protein (predicted Holliday junction resolvase)
MTEEIKLYAYNDMVFKYLMGREECKAQLMGFINAVLQQCGRHPVTDLVINNPFNLQEYKDDKLTILDLRVTDDLGRSFNMEIQSSDPSVHRSKAQPANQSLLLLSLFFPFPPHPTGRSYIDKFPGNA